MLLSIFFSVLEEKCQSVFSATFETTQPVVQFMLGQIMYKKKLYLEISAFVLS